MANFEDFGIKIPSHKHSGTIKIKCPKCGNNPKHKGRTDLSVNISEGVWKCWSASCGWTGTINERKFTTKKEFTKPTWSNNTDLSDKVVKFFESRGISQFTLRENKITIGKDWMPQFQNEVETIHFNYFINNELVNIKYRAPRKTFKMHKDAMLCFYNLDSIKEERECYIVEGEIDALSLYEIGIHNVLSVPNGAGNGNLNLEFIDNSIDYLEHIEKYYIATDNDTPGINLRNELIRRLGQEKCFLIELDKKDANEYLCEKDDQGNYKIIPGGKEQLKEALKKFKEIKIDGIFTCDDAFQEMLNSFKNGKHRGSTTYFKTLDERWTWRAPSVSLFTGYNNEGKTNLFIQLAVLKAYFDNWKFAIFSPENYPIGDFFDDVVHCFVGIGCDPYYANNLMSEQQYLEACNFVNEHFFIINPEDDFTLDTIIEKTRYLVKRKGINWLLLDPYNQVEHLQERGERDDIYIVRFMRTLKKQVASKFNIGVTVIPHQNTPYVAKNEDYPEPDGYKIKGGGSFSDTADDVLTIWRPYRRSDPANKIVKIRSCKIKKQKLVGIPGELELFYSRAKNQYFENLNDCEEKRLSNIEIIKRSNKKEDIFEPQINFYEVEKDFEKETIESPF